MPCARALVNQGVAIATGTTSRRTSTRAPPERRPPPTARHAQPPRTGTSPLPRDKTQTTAHTSTNEPHRRKTGNPHTGDGQRPLDATATARGRPRNRRRAAPGRRPRHGPPRRHNPPRHASANNNMMVGRQMSCPQYQTVPPPHDVAKMSPRISIGPEPVLDAHAPSPPAAGNHARPEKTQLPIAEQIFSSRESSHPRCG